MLPLNITFDMTRAIARVDGLVIVTYLAVSSFCFAESKTLLMFTLVN